MLRCPWCNSTAQVTEQVKEYRRIDDQTLYIDHYCICGCGTADFSDIEPAEELKLRGVELLVVNALHWERHDSHFSVSEALELISRVAPKRAYLTHMSHRIGLYAENIGRLPAGVEFAYDGLSVEL